MREVYDFELMSFAFSLNRISRVNERFHMAVQDRSAALLGARKTSAEYHVILSLLTSEGEVLSPTQLCDYTLQTASGMTKTLKRLENDGLIQRVESVEDARFSMVKLTATGRKLAQKLMKVTLSSYKDIFKNFSPKQFSSMVDLLRLIRKTLEESFAA